MFKKLLRIIRWILGILLLLIVGIIIYVSSVSRVNPPIPEGSVERQAISQPDSGLFTIGNNWFRKSESGLYELYVEGEPYERGLVNGQLTESLVRYQEEVFTTQINQLVPSRFYLNILKFFVGWFNRDLDESVLPEYQQEIYGISQAASPDFNYIAPPYQRILNYHAAHDIGHALQNMSLVGCTAFATWGSQSEDSTLIIGRNFDFYVGDDFARDKIIAFYKPATGHRFMMVTFGGMTGVLSGMNDQGLTVTINAAKSEVPTASATPVSLVAREILQYASTISEAYAIAEKRKTFVAETFLIGSANDGYASIIEKSPSATALVSPVGNELIVTNHFQSSLLGQTELNAAHIKTSASPYRYARVKELMNRYEKNSIRSTASILRNQQGLNDADIGLGNEKAINQLIAHHSIIFEPQKLRVWISTAPWQLGKYVCYQLDTVFAFKPTQNNEVYTESLTLETDTFLETNAYVDYLKFSPFRFPFQSRENLHPDSIVKWNPESYHAWMMAGDYYYKKKSWADAIRCYTQSLTKEIATEQERDYLIKNLSYSQQKLK